jgi:hypothetical protein
MTTLKFGKPIELNETQGRLMELISKGEWSQISPEVLRSLVPDTSVFLEFLAKNDLSDTDEAKAVLKQLGIGKAPKTAVAKAKAAGKTIFWKQRSLKGRYAKRAAAAAKKITDKTKRRKGKKRRSAPTTNHPVKA